mmetsp:Transcript_54879/g.117770  ORF Transcript_54879/g.117770 Transcript_54879/m.117770 type:complete len:378 (-) Transcript_54879:87-1220(-)|eukprot:CAMPEP_0180477854 /NCGR_PEP_ID=MMETSP1036_2-20121128/32476_1 /TAXON_ID=632150 /ORGANISM="Azadinium spinosum, Strain 3D9" /LENGTH=377 /DNA_ID=CAMNT_0022485353 /DNA_START=50 /DNA_END=1183 /DNA_ORIENTATION=+
MPTVNIDFVLGGSTWRRDFAVGKGDTVRRLREVMLQCKALDEEVDSFEVRRDGSRVRDTELLWEDQVLRFKFLGSERGGRRAARDRRPLEAPPVRPPRKGAVPEISLVQAKSLQKELFLGFSNAGFQKELDAAEAQHERSSKQFNATRSLLAMKVQKVVLPKYGFEGGPKGVMQMMQVLTGYGNEMAYLGQAIEHSLRSLPPGIGLPPPVPPKPLAEAPKATTSVDIHFDASDLSRCVNVDIPKDTTVGQCKVVLCQMDPTGSAKPEGLIFFNMERPDKPLEDDTVIAGMSHILSKQRYVDLKVTHAHSGEHIRVMIDGSATIGETRQAVVAALSCKLSQVKLVKKVNSSFLTEDNDAKLNGRTEVFLLGIDLPKPH